MTQHYINIGYNEPTEVYEIKLVKIATIPAGTSLADIIGRLKSVGVTNVLVDTPPRGLDMFSGAGIIGQRAILKTDGKR